MTSHPSQDPEAKGAEEPSLESRFDATCDRFEAAWQAGQEPRLEDFMEVLPEAQHPTLFRELLGIELEWRFRGEREQPTPDQYRRRFPEHSRQIDAAFAKLAGIVQSGDTSLDSTVRHTHALHIRCPDCQNAIELVDDNVLAELTCPSCGSKFTLVGGQAAEQGITEQTRTIGHFELIEQLGVGAFGAVWKARDATLDRVVAVKTPRRGQLSREETEQFLREARAAAQLRHPGIVSVHEVGLEDETVFIVSDFIEGLSLDKWLERQKPNHRESAALCAKIAEALHFAHQQGVIHRDLKPANVMIDASGQPHIMDFGLAKREAGEITMTLEGQVLGTPAYMSPEQAKGEGHTADRRTDVYSLGVILFELLTGERPFRGSVRMLLQQVIEDEPPSPRRINPRVPRDLETVCLRCLEKRPQDRYPSLDELAADLQRWQQGVPVHARPVGPHVKAWRWVQRNRGLASAVAAAAALLIVLGVVLLGPSKENARPQTPQGVAFSDGALDERETPPAGKSPTAKETPVEPPRHHYYSAEIPSADQLSRSRANLRKIGEAFAAFHESVGKYPPAVVYGPDKKPWHSWRVLILPYLDDGRYANLYEAYDFSKPWDDPANNLRLAKTIPEAYQDPVYGNQPVEYTHYAAITGAPDPTPATAFPGEGITMSNANLLNVFSKMGSNTRLVDLRDGAANTILVGPVSPQRKIPWSKPEDVVFSPQTRILPPDQATAPADFAAPYQAGQLRVGPFLLADGTTCLLTDRLDPATLRSLCTIAVGEIVDWRTIDAWPTAGAKPSPSK